MEDPSNAHSAPPSEERATLYQRVDGSHNIFSGSGDVSVTMQEQRALDPVLPFLADREEVRSSVKNICRRRAKQPDALPFCLIRSGRSELFPEFFGRLRVRELPEFFRVPMENVQLVNHRLPDHFSDADDLDDQLRESLAEQLADYSQRGPDQMMAAINFMSPLDELASFVNTTDQFVLVHCLLDLDDRVEEVGKKGVELLVERFFAFWSNWASLFTTPRVAVFFAVISDHVASSGRSFEPRTLDVIMQSGSEQNLVTERPRDLGPLRLRDLQEWSEWTRERGYPTVPSNLIVEKFQSYPKPKDKDVISMGDAASLLMELLKDNYYKKGGAA